MARFQKKMRKIGETDTKDRVDDKRFVSEIGEKGASVKEKEKDLCVKGAEAAA